MANSDSTTVNDFSSSKYLKEIYYSESLRSSIKIYLYKFNMSNLITVEEILSDVVLELFKAQQYGKEIINPIAWARTVSYYCILKYLRKERKHAQHQYQLNEQLDKQDILQNIPSSYYDEDLISKEEKEEIYKKIQLLKPENKKIIIWRYYKNHSWQEITELLSQEGERGISITTVRQRGARALKELRNLYMHSANNLLTEQKISVPFTVENHQENTKESELVKEIRQKIHQLSPAEQKLLTWRFIDNLSWNQIAELLSKEEGKALSTATIRKRGERAIRKLKETHVENI